MKTHACAGLLLVGLILPGCGSLASWGGFGRGRFGLPGPGPFPEPFGGVRKDARAISDGFWPAMIDIPLSLVLDLVALPITAIGSYLERSEPPSLTQPGERVSLPAPAQVEAPPPLGPGATIVFVVDVSETMAWEAMTYEAPDGRRRVGVRLDRVRAEVARRIAALPPTVALWVVAAGAEARALAAGPVVATDEAKAAAIAWLEELQPEAGGIDTARAIDLALASERPALTVVLFTDGLPTRGGAPAEHRARIRAADRRGARIDVHGVGVAGSARAFCEAVARDGGGSFVEMP